LWTVIALPRIAALFLVDFQDVPDFQERRLNTLISAAASDAIGVLIADSNRMQAQLLTSALRRHSEFHTTTCPMDSASILHAVALKNPRIAILSSNLLAGVPEAVAALRRFHFSHPEIPKILLVDNCDRDLAVNAFRSGARGIFCITDANLRLLCKCLLRVASGQIWASTEQLNYLLDVISEVPSVRVLNSRGNPLLTPREEQVVALVAEGLSNRLVAGELNLSEHTIKKYLFRIFEKLGVSTRVELVLYAVNNGDPRQAEWLAGASRVLPTA
jgi:DNA-binding NarL/FixJ family response regulator